MNTPLQEVEALVRQAIRIALDMDADPAVAASQNPQFGDYQSNAAMQIAGRLKKETGQKINPHEVAQKLVEAIGTPLVPPLLAEAPSIAGPGFINFTLAPAAVAEMATRMLTDPQLGIEAAARKQTIVVEYSSPNIAKQMHVGHIRTTVLGDAIARLLAFLGHVVIRQNHVGDWGTQFGMLIERLREAGGIETAEIGDLELFYREAKKRFDSDEEFKARARDTVVKLQRGNKEESRAWQRFVEETRKHTQAVYQRLGVLLEVDDERGESAYNDRLGPLTEELLAAGVAEVSDGAVVSFVEGYNAPLIIRKSNGGFGYGTTDLAAAEFRAKELKADRAIYVVGAPQTQHFRQVFGTYRQAVEKAGWPGEVDFEHASFGSILGYDGKPISTRNLDKSLPPDVGPEVLQLQNLLDIAVERARRVVEEINPDLPEAEKIHLARTVGIGAVKYADLSKDRNSDYVFSFDEMLRLDGNSGPYMQYAHARVKSVLRKAADAGLEPAQTVSVLESPHELALAKALLSFGDAVRDVARDLKPHILCNYLYDLARAFSGFYETCPILKSEGGVQKSRLALADLTGRTLACGLDLLGIGHPERM